MRTLLLAALVIVACSNQTRRGGDDDDAEGDGDADTDSDSDTDADADADARNVGEPCDSHNDCTGTGAECITEAELGWPDGYCTTGCPCGAGEACWVEGEVCLVECSGDPDCRAGYVCGDARFEDGCVPACESHFVCGNGAFCDDDRCAPSAGTRDVWQTCTDDECEGFCLTAADFGDTVPVGFTAACTVRCDQGEECPAGSVCPADLGICLKSCASDDDCTLNGADICGLLGADRVCWY